MWINPDDLQIEMEQVLDAQGQLIGEMPDISDDELRHMYRQMLTARLYDERAVRLQRQGRLGTYAPSSGQEAAQVGSSSAILKTDWIYSSYRELPALFVHGMPMERTLSYTMGHVRGGYVPEDVNAFPVQIIIAGQTLHAVGGAWASQYLNDGRISICYLGDGATSQGDFHESLNFASVFKLPVVFFVQNNGFAISMPRHRQSRSATLAQKALAYGMPGILVDGNDILAVYQVTREAAKRARSGEGPVLIEAVTFRQGAHTTSDDPTRYRSFDEVQAWLTKDPITRFKHFLISRGLWDEEQEEEAVRISKSRIAEAVETAERGPKGTLIEAIDLVYAKTPANLNELREKLESPKAAQGV